MTYTKTRAALRSLENPVKIFILIWLILAPLANAQPKDLHLGGFGTLGVIWSDSKEYGHRTNLDQSDGSFNNTPDYVNSSVLGLQLDYTLPTTNTPYPWTQLPGWPLHASQLTRHGHFA